MTITTTLPWGDQSLRSARDWLQLAEEQGSNNARLNSFSSFYQWLEAFICQPHPDLGREADVCPFVRAALQQNQIYFLTTAMQRPNVEEVSNYLTYMGERFLSLVPEQKAHRSLKCLTVLFFQLDADHESVLKKARINIREHLYRQGIAIGEFYPSNQDGGIHNPSFRVANSPVPAVVFRYLAEHDRLFLPRQTELQSSLEEGFAALKGGLVP